MPSGSDLSKLDLSTIDVRTITPAEWEAVKREAIRRAHAERAKAARDLVRQLRSWWQERSGTTPVVQAGKNPWS